MAAGFVSNFFSLCCQRHGRGFACQVVAHVCGVVCGRGLAHQGRSAVVCGFVIWKLEIEIWELSFDFSFSAFF